MKKTERVAIICVAIFIVMTIGVVAIGGVGSGKEYAAEYKQKEEEREDEFRRKVDKLFEDMAEDVIKYTKQTETVDDPLEEESAVNKVCESLGDGRGELINLNIPSKYGTKYSGDFSVVDDKLLQSHTTCSQVILLYIEEDSEKAYDEIQTIIDEFADAMKAKNKMFGYK